MNVLNVIYKDTTVNINYFSINIDEDYIQIYFINTQNNDCKFFCQYLDANRIDYEKKERDSYTIIKVDANVFNLNIAVKSPIRSSEVYNNFYDAIRKHKQNIANAEAIIAKYEAETKDEPSVLDWDKILDPVKDDELRNKYIELLKATEV